MGVRAWWVHQRRAEECLGPSSSLSCAPALLHGTLCYLGFCLAGQYLIGSGPGDDVGPCDG